MKGVLEGVRVLDFGRYIAGPFCTTLLGDFGADVIRIEKLEGSEDRYVWPLGETSDTEGAYFLHFARNKRCMTLNPASEQGREIVRRLVRDADVVVANMPQDALVKLGLDYATLSGINPRIILAAPSAFGSTGPYAKRLGFDGVAQAMSGEMHVTGHPGEPMKSYVPYVDFGTAMLSAYGIALAILDRERTGLGQEVSGSLLATALTMAGSIVVEQSATGINREGTGNRAPNSGPADTLRTRDGWILVHCVGRGLFKRWAMLMGEDHWLEDPRFMTDQDRGDNGEVLSERMAAWCAERTTEEALAALEEARIPCGPVYSPQQVLDDPHVRETGLLKSTSYPGISDKALIPDTPIRLSRTPGGIRSPAPELGADTDDILTSLGYEDDEIAAFHRDGVV